MEAGKEEKYKIETFSTFGETRLHSKALRKPLSLVLFNLYILSCSDRVFCEGVALNHITCTNSTDIHS